MPKITLTLDGQVFKRQYLIYVIELVNGDRKYFYVGQTGDRRYTTARPPVRRLIGHLDDVGRSTQNQLYRFVAGDILRIEDARKKATFTENLKQRVEDFFVQSVVRMHVYQVEPFTPGISHVEHCAIRERVEELERHVLKAFKNAGFSLANRSFPAPTERVSPYPEVFSQVLGDFSLLN
jgi:hypothetical protein